MSDSNFPVTVLIQRPNGSTEHVRVGTAVRVGDSFRLTLGELAIGMTPDAAPPRRRAAQRPHRPGEAKAGFSHRTGAAAARPSRAPRSKISSSILVAAGARSTTPRRRAGTRRSASCSPRWRPSWLVRRAVVAAAKRRRATTTTMMVRPPQTTISHSEPLIGRRADSLRSVVLVNGIVRAHELAGVLLAATRRAGRRRVGMGALVFVAQQLQQRSVESRTRMLHVGLRLESAHWGTLPRYAEQPLAVQARP